MQRQKQLRLSRSARRPTLRGVGLIEALIALALLAFGMLAMTRFQSRLISQGTDVQMRMTATQLSDELMNRALVDPANPGCYTEPEEGACASAAARDLTDAWVEQVNNTLPGDENVSVLYNAASHEFSATLTWVSKDGEDERSMTAVTDVR
jgi:type IV pilus assembly protein PilV